jgi:PiT family inorganic phosphate transporter
VILAVSSFFVSFVLGWNNSGITTGNLSNLLHYNIALALTLLGVFVGLLIEGSKMSSSLVGRLVTGHVSTSEVTLAIIITGVLFLVLTLLKVPVSLSNCAVGAFAGVGLGALGSVSGVFAIEVASSWVLAPFACAALSAAIYELIVRTEGSMALTTISWANRIILIVSVFYVSYALGANNLGMIISVTRQQMGTSSGTLILLEAASFLSLAVGTVLFGKSIAHVVGDKIVGLSQVKTLSAILGAATLTWLLTQFSIPVSLTQLVIGGMLGAGIVRGPDLVNQREVLVMVRDWVGVTVLAILVGLAIESLIRMYY